MSRGEADRLALFNARIETVRTKASFRQAWREGRALLPVTAWIEWRPGVDGGKKQPFLIRRTDGRPVVLAAIAAPHEGTPTFALLTTAADPSLSWLHGRAPVAVPSRDWDAWLTGTLPHLTPLPGSVYEVLPLNPCINDARLDHPGVVQVTGEAVRAA